MQRHLRRYDRQDWAVLANSASRPIIVYDREFRSREAIRVGEVGFGNRFSPSAFASKANEVPRTAYQVRSNLREGEASFELVLREGRTDERITAFLI